MALLQPTRTQCEQHYRFLFGLAPGGVYHAMECCHPCGALLPHHFTLTGKPAVSFLLHFPWAHAPRDYLAPCSVEPGLSSVRNSDCLANSQAQL